MGSLQHMEELAAKGATKSRQMYSMGVLQQLAKRYEMQHSFSKG